MKYGIIEFIFIFIINMLKSDDIEQSNKINKKLLIKNQLEISKHQNNQQSYKQEKREVKKEFQILKVKSPVNSFTIQARSNKSNLEITRKSSQKQLIK